MMKLEVSNITKKFSGITAVDNVSFSVEGAQIMGIIGPNGAGKTTLFNIISGFLDADGGDVILNEEPISDLHPYQISQKGLVRTFQEPKVFPKLNVLENLLVAGESRSNESVTSAIVSGQKPTDNSELMERASEVLETIDLSDMANERASGLSGGQRKLLELGKSLMIRPDIIMLDEPTAGVHPRLTDDIVETIKEINKSENVLFFVIEHDTSFVERITDNVFMLSNGQLIAEGSMEELRNNEAVVEAYLT